MFTNTSSSHQVNNAANVLLFSFFILAPLYAGYTYIGNAGIVGALFGMLVIQSCYFIFIFPCPGLSFFKTYFVFSYIFFSFVPLLDYLMGNTYWGAPIYSDEVYIKTLLLILAANSVFAAPYLLLYKKFKKANQSSNANSIEIRVLRVSASFPRLLLTATICVLCVLVTVYNNNFSLTALIYRGSLEGFLESKAIYTDIWAFLVINGIVRYTPAIFLIYSLVSLRGNVFLKFLFLVSTLICTFPSGIPRFAVGALYVPLLVLVLPKLAIKNRLPLILVAAIVLVMPFLDNFRFYGRELSGYNLEWFFTGHFDSFQSVLIVIGENYITWGKQLSGALLFFIPRIFWPEKPYGTGFEIASAFQLDWSNISANIYAEGFTNFGFIGAVTFAIILGVACCKMDQKFWASNSWKSSSKAHFYSFYLVMIGFIPFVLRGDLMSSTTYIVSFLVPLLLIHHLL